MLFYSGKPTFIRIAVDQSQDSAIIEGARCIVVVINEHCLRWPPFRGRREGVPKLKKDTVLGMKKSYLKSVFAKEAAIYDVKWRDGMCTCDGAGLRGETGLRFPRKALFRDW